MIWLIACSENELVAKEDAADEELPTDDAPDIEVSPARVNFGEVALGSENVATITVTNAGSGTLLVDSPRLARSNADLTVSALGSSMLAAGATTDFVVTWVPVDGDSLDNAVLVDSNDADEPSVEVPLGGTLPAGEIEVTPSSYDFGTVTVGASTSTPVTVSNVGEGPLTVSSLRFEATDSDLGVLDYGGLALLPAVLAPGEATVVTVSYAPSDGSGDEGTLGIFSDDPDTYEAGATFTGQGEDPDPCDGFTQHVKLTLTADDAWEGWLDGVSFNAPGQYGWDTIDTLEWDLACGDHALALYATDTAQVIAGVLAAIEVEGTVTFVSGGSGWTMYDTTPPADWTDIAFDDSAWHVPEACGDTSPWGSTPQPLYDLGARWIWWTSDCRNLGEAWVRLNFTVP
ncbi:MAG: choice-of-anchor D domain-containing protein [Deltaproteobacteria bacterium]|nr:choice-of-anchor D domain-containing protein [Deltaproteobacteria bacterium]